MHMNLRLQFVGIALFFVFGAALFFVFLNPAGQPSLAQQAAAPLAPTTPATPAHDTARPKPEEVARLQTGPVMNYKLDANWPSLPNGYNFGESAGVDVDKQGNVWVFNRGHWPMIEFDRSGK